MCLLGFALQLNDGLYSPLAVLVMALALVLCVVGVLMPGSCIDSRTQEAFIAGLVAMQLFSMLLHRPGASSATVPLVDQRIFATGIAIATIAIGFIVLGRMTVAKMGFALLITTFAAMGVWKIRTAPHPRIDVYEFQHDAAYALIHGVNPYTLTFADPYGPEAKVYAPGVVRDGRLQFGYPYMPVTLLITTPAQLIFGDFRYAQLLAMALTGILLVALRGDRLGMLVAALLLFTPRGFYVLEMGWTEPLSVCLLAITVACEAWLGDLAGGPLGLLMGSKQYLLAAIVLPRRESRRAKYRNSVFAVIVAALVTLPFLLWNFRAFWYSAITLQLHQPYRADALSFMAMFGFSQFWPAFVALIVAILAAHWRKLSLPAALAMGYFMFFAFNKQAFANYYYLVLGAMACENCIASRK